ncbi:unnamed protein product [Lathyrus sativus]|nr:unnamed protein product [Lathyrus sativus]CAK8059929.1 unnamed protein product [Lathyrus sativus]
MHFTDIFNIFWDNKGKLKHVFCKDINVLVALFEASQLSIEEDYLDSAGQFCNDYLNEWSSTFQDHVQDYTIILPSFPNHVLTSYNSGLAVILNTRISYNHQTNSTKLCII